MNTSAAAEDAAAGSKGYRGAERQVRRQEDEDLCRGRSSSGRQRGWGYIGAGRQDAQADDMAEHATQQSVLYISFKPTT
jgi:hypothetical protein